MDLNSGQGDAFLRSLAGFQSRAQALVAKGLWRRGQQEEAEKLMEAALAEMRNDALRIRQAIMMPLVSQSVAQIDQSRRRVEERLRALLEVEDLAVTDPSIEIDWTLFLLAYHGAQDNRPLHGLFHQVCRKANPDLAWRAPHIDAPRRPGRMRIGFVSWFLGDHTIDRLFSGLIARLDPQDFQVILYPGANLPTKLDDARSAIAAAELDLLVYLDIGMDPFTLFLAHARLARHHAVLWGHPDSTALPSIDYFLVPDAAEAIDGESHYSEKLVRLPGVGSWIERPTVPETLPLRSEFGLPDGGPLILCPQTPSKFHPDFDPLIHGILEALPDAHFAITAGPEPAAMELVRQRIGDSPRIHLVESLPRPRFIGLLAIADLILDPPHYSGGHTSLEAFACGTPIVTWPGKYLRARVTAGLYRLMGIGDGITDSLDGYVDLAVKLVGNLDLRRRIREQSSFLFEDATVVMAFEAFLRSLR